MPAMPDVHREGAGISGQTLIASLCQQIDDVLTPLLPGDEPCALLHFPSASNAGDNAIWFGQTAYLHRRGIRIAYACEVATYSKDLLAARIGRGPILLQGGGSLGDLWPAAEALRERVITDFPGHSIVQLPQTIHFRDIATLRRVRAVFDRHRHLILLVRDQRSLEFARNEFAAKSLLCPDMAFALGPVAQRSSTRRGIVGLLRTDQESAPVLWSQVQHRLERKDWRTDTPLVHTLNRGARLLQRGMNRAPRTAEWSWPVLLGLYNLIARRRLTRGLRMLATATCIITDRLHGHILCLLSGVPHVVLDNSYGKVRAFYETWTRNCDLVRWAESPSEALRQAEAFACPPGTPVTQRRSMS